MTRPPILSASISEPQFNDPAWATRVLDLAEAAGIDLLLLGRAGATPFDALVLAAWAAPRTKTVGLVACVPASIAHPFHVARALSAVDFLCQGRSGWNPVAHGAPVAQVEDMVGAARSLWDGWDADCLIIDKASGRYLDTTKIRPSHYRGEFYKVRGPVNAMRPPQGHPLLVVDAASPFTVAGADIAIAGTGETAPAAARTLLRTTLAASAETMADGLHFDLTDAMAELPLIAQRYAVSARDVTGTLRERLGLALHTREGIIA